MKIENGVWEPCPYCESKDVNLVGDSVKSDDGDWVFCNNCGAMAYPINWNSRPGEDAARQKQLDEDCNALCGWCRDGLRIQLPFTGEWKHSKTKFCAASPLRSAWEEHHDKD